IGDDFPCGCIRLRVLVVRAALLRSLKRGFEIDGDGLASYGDEVLLQHIGDGEAVQEPEPGACAAEEAGELLVISASRVLDEFRPPIPLAGKGVCHAKIDGSLSIQ